jgi:hypothetical protein
MKLFFDQHVSENSNVKNIVQEFLTKISTLETSRDMPIFIFQDGVSGSYYIKCSLLASDAARLSDLDARLDVSSPVSYKANRNLLLQHNTYIKMETDALKGREFNDIIVEYTTVYNPDKPLKVWGGQHRISVISKASATINRYHGFRIYFNLTKDQRTEVALISNTNISVSNDTFDRMVEETLFGDILRKWCQTVGFLSPNEDFPDAGSRSEKITVKRARSFVVNFYKGLEQGAASETEELDRKVYEPYLTITGVSIDPEYQKVMNARNIIKDEALLKAGQRFLALHSAQIKAVTKEGSKIKNRKAYRNKAFVESVLCGWSHVAGLLQNHPKRLDNHYHIPRVTGKVPDPLNAEEMSQFKHDSDPPTYRGLGTRSSLKDRQRIAQLFLAKSREQNVVLDKAFMMKAVNQLAGLLYGAKGYL